MNNDLVSVVMATYNDSIEYLNLSINSILEQSYKDIELVIIDDSNNDETLKYLIRKSKDDFRIKLVHNETKLGFVKSLNFGITISRGKYIARMDSDDISLPQRIEKQVEYLEKNKEVSILGANINIIDENGTVTGIREYRSNYKDICKVLYYRNPLAHPTVMYRTNVIKNLQMYDETFRMAEDYELWLRAIKNNVIINNLPERLVQYRITSDYYKKRSRTNWKYNIKAKQKNFNCHYLVRNSVGIALPALLYIMPKSVLKFLYDIDRRK